MIKEATATGKSLEEAKEAALKELGASVNDNVEFDIITMPKAKTLGLFGGSDAKVRAFMDDGKEEPAPKAEPAKEKVKSEKPAKNTEEKTKSAVLSKEKEKVVLDYLNAILVNMGVENVKTEVVVEEDGTKINLEGDKLGIVIGRKGDTLDALQHLVSLVANKKQSDYVRITLNPGGYRQKREETLRSVANKSAFKAKKTNKNIILEPMNSYERRIIHNEVQTVEGVESWSIGENEHRRVCIGTSKDNKPYRENNSRNNYRGGQGQRRGGNQRGGYNRNNNRRPSQVVESKSNRAPKADSDKMPLYGVIK